MMEALPNVTGSVFAVTGAAGGIGSAACRRLLASGATVLGLDRDSDGLARLGAGISAARFSGIVCDLSEDDLGLRAEDIAQLSGPVDVLIVAAGVGGFGTLEAIDPRSFRVGGRVSQSGHIGRIQSSTIPPATSNDARRKRRPQLADHAPIHR